MRNRCSESPLDSKRKIGYLPESNPLYYEMYIREYLDFIADIHHVVNKKNKIEEVIQTVGLTPESKKSLDSYPKGISKELAWPPH